jgi:thiamine-monophosphate kinase
MSGDPSGEDRLIATYFAPLARDPRAQGLIDDAAVMTPPPGMDLVLKTDGIVGGVHFFSDESAEAIARKAFRMVSRRTGSPALRAGSARTRRPMAARCSAATP